MQLKCYTSGSDTGSRVQDYTICHCLEICMMIRVEPQFNFFLIFKP